MSQDQTTQSKTENKEATYTRSSQANSSVRDPMASEEIRSSFDNDSSMQSSVSGTPKNTSPFRLGLAEAFAQEENIEKDVVYEPPLLLREVDSFMSNFDFDDRSNPIKGFQTVSAVHHDIRTLQMILRGVQGQSSLSFQARNQIQDDLYRLQSFQHRVTDYMEETKPTF